MVETSLPRMPDGLTAAWLTEKLHAADLLPAGSAIAAVTQSQIGEGVGMMSELARLTLDVAGDPGAVPGTLVAKFPSRNANNRNVAMTYRLYERETRYFAELDKRTAAYSPRTYLTELEGDNFLILMEDMSEYRVGDQVAGADLADTERMLDELAKLHAAFWNRVDDLDWVPHIANSYHADNMASLIRIGWPNMVKVFGDYLHADCVSMEAAFVDALPALQQAMNTMPVTLIHGDFRMENVFFGTRREHHPIAIIDWQGPLLGKGVVDVGTMLGQSTRSDVRTAHERALIARYAERLAALGVREYSAAQAWDDYRLAQLYNWVYVGVVSGTLDATNERGFAWMSQMVARQSVMTRELDLPGLLREFSSRR
ncbi:MAG: phosphotransferase [Pseudomonadales bacterium]|nr:phosphotransferase [Pseudomonadales bacterium]MCP5185136.1 phosphotransferase [Pseudomonadales bacterium]